MKFKEPLIYGADFETDNDGVRAWIVQWSCSNGSKNFHGPDLTDWMDFLKQLIE